MYARGLYSGFIRYYASYMEKKLQANRDYADRLAFGRKCLLNIASGAKFPRQPAPNRK